MMANAKSTMMSTNQKLPRKKKMRLRLEFLRVVSLEPMEIADARISSAGKSPPELLHPHLTRNPSVKSLIQERIVKSGPISFADYMAMALYTPDHGYYAKGSVQVGREGDFYTSVSVGPVFGQLLARHILSLRREFEEARAWRIIECGAHDGRLACDILDAIGELDEAAYQSLEYAIVDPDLATMPSRLPGR